MKHLGDITRINGYTVAPVNVIIGGSPCQDLSIAGKRAGLAGERSGLFMEQIRIIKEMRDADAARGRTGRNIRPRWMVWENVPGALSSNGGKDFQAVLTEFIRIAEPDAPDVPLPAKGKWPLADAYYGDGWSVAYRVHDAQFWGVPQRRRRIALVADFGGLTAPEILFERQGLRGDFAESGTAEKGVAAAAGTGVETAISLLNCNHEQPIICLMDQGGSVMEALLDKTGTLRAQEHGHQPVILQLYENHGQDSRITGPLDIAPTVAQKFGTGGNNTPLVLAFKYHQGAGARGLGEQEEVSPSLCADGGHPPAILAVDCRNGTLNPDVNGTLQAKSTGGQSLNLNNVALTVTEDRTILLDGQPCTVVRMEIRRLTPLECERLQGYPDGWTDIGPWVDSKGKLHKESSDSARYKALGNSIALPPWAWILTRLSLCAAVEPTMASLFDGISGFVCLWTEINGWDSVKWTSEIDDFATAVCKKHFGDEETGEGGDFYKVW